MDKDKNESKWRLFILTAYAIIIVVVIFGIAFIISSASYMKKSNEKIYNTATELLQEEKYDEAFKCFTDIPNYINYRDVKELLESNNICPYCGHKED